MSLTLDGQAQTTQALVRAFPPGEDHPELALVRALGDHILGRLDEAAAHLDVAEFAGVSVSLPNVHAAVMDIFGQGN